MQTETWHGESDADADEALLTCGSGYVHASFYVCWSVYVCVCAMMGCEASVGVEMRTGSGGWRRDGERDGMSPMQMLMMPR